MANEKNSPDEKKTAKKKVAKKKVVKKTEKKKAAKNAPTLKRTASSKPPLSDIHKKVSPTERHEMIATVAYYRAEQRGFTAGYQREDWLAAEKIVDNRLRETESPPELDE